MASSSADGRRQMSESGEDWTLVGRKGRRGLLQAQDRATTSRSGRTTFLSVSDIEKEHRRITDQWETSACCHQLRRTLASRTCRPGISQAICMGLGSFDPEDGSWTGKRIAHVQLAAFLCMVEQLQLGNPQKICCLFQEPRFNSADKAFIECLGHQVVESPEGFERVSPSSLIFGIHLYKDIYSQAIAHHLPAVFVGTPHDVWEQNPDGFHGCTDLAKLKELDEACEKVDFPEDVGFHTFSTTTIHWRRRQDKT
ncbi:hypothetical protein GGR54DRAFT_612934 [Hypoxylon sp. NC1633]|nr:hypothetical protein GGR54DRAFT_612934 [Hypoxylon sp. NC1633]